MRLYLLAAVTVVAVMIGASSELRAQAPGSATPAGRPATLVNLNTATVEQLTALPGIGARTAQLIVEHRQKNGPFKKAEDLMNVKGVGEKSFLRLKTLVSVAAPKE
jgi:competence protein ComEA